MFSRMLSGIMRIRFILRAGIGAGVIGWVILTPLLAIPVLNAIGFSTIGPVAGTLAAGIQSGIGNVAAGGLFATAQATAMGAGIPLLFNVIGGVVTGVLGVAGAAIARAFGFWR